MANLLDSYFNARNATEEARASINAVNERYAQEQAKREQERQAKLAREQQAQQVQQQSAQPSNGLSEYEQQAYNDLVSQGANEQDAMTAVKNGGSVTHDADIFDNAIGLAKQTGASFLKDINAIAGGGARVLNTKVGDKTIGDYVDNIPGVGTTFGTIKGVADMLFGEGTFKDTTKKVEDFADKNTEKISQFLESNRTNSMDHVVSYNKKTGEYKVESEGGIVGDFLFDAAGAVPLMLECASGPVGMGLASYAKGSDAMYEYKLTDKEENDLWDLACAIGKGVSLALTMKAGGKLGESAGKFVSDKAGVVFQKLANKFGTTATGKFLTNRIVAFLGSQSGALVSGETMMVGDTVLGDAIDMVFKGYDKDLAADMKESASAAFSFYGGMQAGHAIKNFRKPFKFRGEYKSWKEATNIYADNLKKNGFTLDGGEKVVTGQYEKTGKKCFVTKQEEGNGNVHIKYKDKDNNDRYTDAVVKKEEVKITDPRGKDVNTFAGSELVRFVKPDTPIAFKDSKGNYQYKIEGDGKGAMSNVNESCDGDMFYVVEDGKKQMRVYNATENEMQPVEEYDYFKRLNSMEVPEDATLTDNVKENVKEQPTETQQPTDVEVKDNVKETPSVSKVDELDRDTFVNVDEEGVESVSTIEYGGDNYVVPKGTIEALQESGNFATKAYKINTNGGLEKVTLFIEEPNKASILNTGDSPMELPALKKLVGEVKEEVEPTEKIEGDNGNDNIEGSANGADTPADPKVVGEPTEKVEGTAPTIKQDNPTPPAEPKPADTPLIGKNFVVDLSKGATGEEIFNEIISKRNPQTEIDFEPSIASIEKQRADAKKEGRFDDMDVLGQVLYRLETAKKNVKEQAKAEEEARKLAEKEAKKPQQQTASSTTESTTKTTTSRSSVSKDTKGKRNGEQTENKDVSGNDTIVREEGRGGLGNNSTQEQKDSNDAYLAQNGAQQQGSASSEALNALGKIRAAKSKEELEAIKAEVEGSSIADNEKSVALKKIEEASNNLGVTEEQKPKTPYEKIKEYMVDIVNDKGGNKNKRNRLDALRETEEYKQLSDEVRVGLDMEIEDAKEPFLTDKMRKERDAKKKAEEENNEPTDPTEPTGTDGATEGEKVEGDATESTIGENVSDAQPSLSDIHSACAKLIKDGYIVHGTNAEFEKFDSERIKGGFRAREGYGAYFTDMPYKAYEYGNRLKCVKKDLFEVIKLSDPASNHKDLIDFLLNPNDRIQRDIYKYEQLLDYCKSNREYDEYNQEIENLKSKLIDVNVDLESSIRRCVEEYKDKNIGSLLLNINYPKEVADLLKKYGYDGYYHDGIYAIFNFDKLNENLKSADVNKVLGKTADKVVEGSKPLDSVESTPTNATEKTAMELAKEADDAVLAELGEAWAKSNTRIENNTKFDTLKNKVKNCRISVENAEKELDRLVHDYHDGYAVKALEVREEIDKLKKNLGIKDEAPAQVEGTTTKKTKGGLQGDNKDTPQKWINNLDKYRGNNNPEKLYNDYSQALTRFREDGADVTKLEKVVEQLEKEKNDYSEGQKRLKNLKKDELKSPRTISVDALEGIKPEAESKSWNKFLNTIFGKSAEKKNKKEFFDNIYKYAGTKDKFDLRDAIESAFESVNGIPKWLNPEQARLLYKMLGRDVESKKYADILNKMDALNKQTGEMNIDFSEEVKESVETQAPKHILSEEQFDALKKGLERSGLFSRVKVVEDLIGRYEKMCGKQAADAIRNSKGQLLGFTTKNGEIFLNKKALSADTLVHETAHCLFRAFRAKKLMTDKQWDEMKMLAEKSGALDELPAVYRNMSADAKVEEAMVRAIGKKGGINLHGSLWERFVEKSKQHWNTIKAFLGFDSAKAELSFNELADFYADKIVNGKYDAAEQKALDELKNDVSKTIADLNAKYSQFDAEDVETHTYENGGLWNANYLLDKRSSHLFKPLDAHGLGDQKESLREKISRHIFDTFDPLYRVMLEIRRGAGVFDGKSDIVSRLAQQMAINIGKQRDLTHGEIKNLRDAFATLRESGIEMEDLFTGDKRAIDDELINQYLMCMDSANGGSERIYNNIIKALREETLGKKEEQIRNSAKHAMFIAKQASNKMRSMSSEIYKYELEYQNAFTEEEKARAEKKLVNAYRRILTNNNVVLKKAVDMLNYIKSGIRQDEKRKFEEEHANDPSATYVPSKDFEATPSLLLHTAKHSTKGLEQLRELYNNAKKSIDNVVEEIEQRKIQDRIDKIEKELQEKIAEDKARMTATDWLHTEWMPNNKDLQPVWDNFKEDLYKARAEGRVQKWQTDGRGVSPERASEFIKKFHNAVPKKMCENLTDAVKQMNLFTLNEAHNGKCISDEQYKEMKNRAENEFYSPQRGFKYEPKKAEVDFDNILMTDGGTIDTKLLIQAKGRIQEAANVYDSLIVLAQSSISQGGKNGILCDWFDFLNDCKHKRGKQKGFQGTLDSIVTLGKWYKYDDANHMWVETEKIPNKELQPKNGVYTDSDGVKYRWEGGETKEMAQDFAMNPMTANDFGVTFNYNGKKVQMVYKQQRVANALNGSHKNLSGKSAFFDKLLYYRKKVNNFESQCLTSFSLKFAFNNHKRDLALYELKLAGSGYKGVQGSFFSCYSDVWNYIMRGSDIEIAIDEKGNKMKMSEILNQNGLATGYAEMGRQERIGNLEKEIEQIRNKEAKLYKKNADGKYTNEEVESAIQQLCDSLKNKTPEEARKVFSSSIEKIGEMAIKGGDMTFGNIAKLSEFLELVPRLAAFKVAIKNGADFEQAVNFGKEITTNFNRKGDLAYTTFGKYWYASTPFLNAGFQGLKNFKDYAQTETSRTAKIMAGMFVVGFIMAELERDWYGNVGDSDMPYITAMDDYNRGSSIRIPLGDQDYFQWDMAHGFRSPLNAAMQISDFVHGQRTWSQAWWGMVGAAGDLTHWDFSKMKEGPVEGLGAVATQFAPQLASTILDVYVRNENFFGSKIYGEAYDEDKDIAPQWTHTVGNSTYGWLIDACEYLNRKGGGTEDKAAGVQYIRDDGSKIPNRDDDMRSWLDIHPQKVQYLLTQSVPVTQFVEAAYRSYKKSEEKDAPMIKKVSDATKSVLAFDKVFVRTLPDENIAASKLGNMTKKSMEYMRQQKGKGWHPTTPREREMAVLYERINKLQKQERDCRKMMMKADQHGNDALVKKFKHIDNAKRLQLASEQFKFYMLQVGDTEEAIKDAYEENIHGKHK